MNKRKYLKISIKGKLLSDIRKSAYRAEFGEAELNYYTIKLIKKGLGFER